MIKSFNSDPFKVIFSIYKSCQKHCFIARSHSYDIYIYNVNLFENEYIYIFFVLYYLVKMELK